MKKLASLLEPGDVIAVTDIGGPANYRLVMLRRTGPDLTNDGILFGYLNGDGPNHATNRYFMPGAEVDVVERSELTPAQARADELVELLRNRNLVDRSWGERADAILGEIDPPVPPTFDEVLHALADTAKYINLNYDGLDEIDRVAADRAEVAASAMLKRARAAGMLP